MPYNQKTAIENQKAFLRSQAKCGHPNIEKQAKKTLKAIKQHEKEQRELDKKIKRFNEQWDKTHRKNSK